MDAIERQNEIINLLNQMDRVEVDDLSRRFGVSLQTVRTDLRDLSARGQLSRVHGGAVRIASAANRDYADRRRLNADGKLAMAALAAEVIPENCSIALNIGTSTEQVARALAGHSGLTILSNNINIINMMMTENPKNLILVGGSIRLSDGAIVGDEAVEFINRYKVDFAVIGASAMDADGAIMDHDAREVAVARAILRNARSRILVCDGSKFDRSAPVRICDVGALDFIVTDRPVPREFAAAAQSAGTRILVTGAASENESTENEHSF